MDALEGRKLLCITLRSVEERSFRGRTQPLVWVVWLGCDQDCRSVRTENCFLDLNIFISGVLRNALNLGRCIDSFASVTDENTKPSSGPSDIQLHL